MCFSYKLNLWMPYPYKLLAATAEKGVNVSNNMLDH